MDLFKEIDAICDSYVEENVISIFNNKNVENNSKQCDEKLEENNNDLKNYFEEFSTITNNNNNGINDKENKSSNPVRRNIIGKSKNLGCFSYKIYKNYQKHTTQNLYEANGFLYLKYSNHKTANRIYLICKNKTCKAKAVIYLDWNEDELHLRTKHNHEDETKEVIVKLKFLNEIIQIAREGCYNPQEAYQKALKCFRNDSKILEKNEVMNLIYRIINKEKNTNLAANNDIIKFAEVLKERKDKYGNIFQESIIDPEKNTCSIIFADKTVCKEMSGVELLIDCSFKINFKNATNYFLIITMNSYSYKNPCFYALMNDFSKQEIIKVLTLFRDKYAGNILPLFKILSDINGNLQESIAEVYSCSLINTSLFHYVMNIFEKFCGIIEVKDNTVMWLFNYLCALPLFPPHLINAALLFLEEKSRNFNQNLKPLFTYIKTYFIQEITPEVLSNYRQVTFINDDILELYKKIQNILGVQLEYEYLEFAEQLLELHDHFSCTNLKNTLSKNSLEKILETLWEINIIEFEDFFKHSLPIVGTMLKVILIRGCSERAILNELILFNEQLSNGEINEEMFVEKDCTADAFLNKLVAEFDAMDNFTDYIEHFNFDFF